MADIKISGLPGYTGGLLPTSTDVLPIVDTSQVTYVSRKIPWSSFTNLAVGLGGSLNYGPIKLLAGTNVTIVDNGNGSFTFNSSGGGGGGGGFSTIAAAWTNAGSATKDAYSAPSVANNDGITITLVAQSDPGVLPAWTISLGGVALSGTFAATGSFPNYTITVPGSTLAGNSAETTPTVSVALTSSKFNLTANALNNTQPIPFGASIAVSYESSLLPYYTTTSTVNWAYTIAGSAPTYAGVLTPGGVANTATGSFTNVATTGIAISGTVTGTGTHGAGQSSVNLSGSIPAVPTYTPAFYVQTADSTVPTFTTSSTQTPGSSLGATIVYPNASATGQYDWIATKATASQVYVVTTFGNVLINPAVSTTASIGGVSLNVFGITGLIVGQALSLYVGA